MLDLLIPKAWAAATSGASDIDPAAAGTIGGIVHYIWTNLDNWIVGVVILILSFFLAKSVSRSATKHLAHVRGEDVPENALVLVDRLVVIGVMSIGIVIAASLVGIQLAAVLGAIGLGVGFALKDIIGNMISSVIMLAQKHVNIGDLIEVNGTLGTIVSIDTRVTVLQSLEGQKIVIPNQQMINQSITSYTSNPFRRLEIFTYISWDSDVEKGMELIRQVMDRDPDILKKPEPMVLLDNIEDESNIAIRVLFWVESHRKWLVIKSNLHHKIIKAFGAVGIEVAYPVRSLTISENVHDTLLNFKRVKEGIVPEEESNELTSAQIDSAANLTQIRKQNPVQSSAAEVQASPATPLPTESVAPAQNSEIPVAPGAPKISLDLDSKVS